MKQTWVKYIAKLFNYKYKYCLQYCIITNTEIVFQIQIQILPIHMLTFEVITVLSGSDEIHQN